MSEKVPDLLITLRVTGSESPAFLLDTMNVEVSVLASPRLRAEDKVIPIAREAIKYLDERLRDNPEPDYEISVN